MICEKCQTEIPKENKFCGSCGAERVEKSFKEEMEKSFAETLKYHKQLWFTIGFFKGIAHDVKNKKHFDNFYEKIAKKNPKVIKEYKELMDIWKEWQGVDVDNFGKKEVKRKSKVA